MDQAWFSIGALFFFFFLSYVTLKQRKKDGQLPSPPSLPLIGHLHLLSNLPHHDLGRLSIRYGPIFSLRLGFVNCVVVSSPQMAKEFLKNHDVNFSSRPVLDVGRILFYNCMDMLFCQYGDHWKHLRKICAQQLFTTKRLKETMQIRVEEISTTLHSIMNASLANRVVDLDFEMSNLANNVITRMSFGKKFFGEGNAEGADRFKEMAREAFDLLGAFNIGDYLPFLLRFDVQGYRRKMQALHLELDALLQKILDEELQAVIDGKTDEADNLVRVLLQVGDQAGELKLEHAAIKAVIEDIILAGTDTVSTTIQWALAELLRSPQLMQRAQQELDNVVGCDRLVEEDDLHNLPFLVAIMKETFRLHPAGPLLGPHESSQDCIVDGYHIPKGTRLMVNIWQMGRDPKVWKNPELFDPDRFSNINIDVKGRDFQLIPFGSGKRICPGMSLGHAMVHIVLAHLLQSFNWKAVAEVDMRERFGLSMRMAKPLLTVATPRSSFVLC